MPEPIRDHSAPDVAVTLVPAITRCVEAMTANAQDVAVYAAGSLRAALTELARAFERASPHKVVLTFGSSGLLHDRIRSGERADVFASANMEHPQSLSAFGWSDGVERFARNSMCVLARPEIGLTTDTMLRTLLDPSVKLGTSTPKADPSGDYAWQVFQKGDLVVPGSFALLSAKARQLTGGAQSTPPPGDRSVYGVLVAGGEADAFLKYCTNAELARKEQPSLRTVRLPPSLAVGADYGLGVRGNAKPAARAFATFMLSPDGQAMLQSYGFDPP